ncbi:retinol dehydrogenase 14-like [Lingula anatina]|uniref:Retinol dehydrogenase 14-like n=1 Tax=Lingula anatina TaxID=7574 RepID=A0A1S3I9L7_LINAN|nr:retinol dehydrogenase 14-like [Lingula anatina]|eukprot:XP_013394960.1 retinol dehydrogenase 14-like [Lingula anatina]
MSKKTIIITGANTGIGFAAARILGRSGDKYTVILACRSEERGQEAVRTIKEESPNADVVYMNLDLSSMASVHKFVENFHASGHKLHVLCNNAGMLVGNATKSPQITQDGLEVTMETNHLGHFLLTSLLLDDLKSTALIEGEARIVVTASRVHDLVQSKMMGTKPTNWDDMNYTTPGSFNSMQAYKDSKLANVMFTRELAKKLEGTNVTVNCFCPGIVRTELGRNNSGCLKCCFSFLLCCCCCLGHSLHQGGNDIVQLAVSDAVKGVTGRYFNDQEEVTPAAEALDDEACKKLWTLSEQMVGGKKEEKE